MENRKYNKIVEIELNLVGATTDKSCWENPIKLEEE